VILLHGVGGSIYDWRHLIMPISGEHRVVAVDFLGAGESDRPAREDYSVGAQARRLRGILDRLGVARGTLVGNSFGGGVALRFAQDWPDRVDRLILLDPVCFPGSLPAVLALLRLPGAARLAEALPLRRLAPWALRSAYRDPGKLSAEELGTYLQELRAPGALAAIVRTLRAVVPPDAREFEWRLGSIRAPALLVWGREDRTLPLEMGRRLARTLPEATLVELASGHVPHQECPQEVLELIRRFAP
jgi:pimeloyl-ACP methyl ester carboxylesterase